jgi:hypothetical protein
MSLDPNQVTQALLNLMLNAVNAMETGGALTIRASVSREGEGLEIQMEDNGPGIDPAVQEKIFEPFFTLASGAPAWDWPWCEKLRKTTTVVSVLKAHRRGKAVAPGSPFSCGI